MIASPVRIAQNTTYLTVAYIVQKIFSFLYFILIARMIGVEDIGKYVFALSFTTIFSVFIDLGLSPVLTREGAKDTSRLKHYLNNIVGVKAVLSTLTYLAVVLMINLIGKEPLVKELVYLSGLIMVLDSFYLSFYAVFRACQNLKYEAIGMIVGQVIIFGTGIAVLFLHLPLHFLIGSILMGSIFNFIYSLLLINKKLDFKPHLRYDKDILKMLFKIAAPFAIAGIFARVYGYIDTVLLSTLAGDKAVGWYSAGYKITFALQFIPMAFAAAIFPAMSNYFVKNKKLLAKTFEKSMHYLMIIALPVTFGVVVLAPELIVAVYGLEFLPTALALQILIFSLVFNFLGFPLGSLLNACNRQTVNTINMGITMVVNVVLNLILIPLFGAQAYLGAAIAALVSGFTLFALGLFWAGRITKYDKKFLILSLAKVLVACLVMTIIILVLKSETHFIFLIPLGGIIYFACLYVVRGLDKKEIKEFYHSFFKRDEKNFVDNN